MAKGTKTGGGSRKGRPNKVTKALKDMVLGALDKAGGEAYLVKQSKDNPVAFMTLLGKVLPTQVSGTVDHRFVARTPPVAESTEEWKRQYAPPTLQ